MSTGTSIWAVASAKRLADVQSEPLHKHGAPGFNFEVVELNDSLCVTAQLTKKSKIAFRTAYSPDGFLNIDVTEDRDGIKITLKALTGNYDV